MGDALNTFDIDYDPANDIMYCSFGDPIDAVSVETSDGVFLRVHAETNMPVGVTIVDLFKRFTERPAQKLSIALTPAGTAS
jgi:hypothetical protein